MFIHLALRSHTRALAVHPSMSEEKLNSLKLLPVESKTREPNLYFMVTVLFLAFKTFIDLFFKYFDHHL